MKNHSFLSILLTIFTAGILILVLLSLVNIINHFPLSQKIIPQFLIPDILVGIIIYLKTSVDFVLFIGTLMRKSTSWQQHLSIEIGTSLGNSIGTFLVLIIWTFFRQIPLLMAIMIFLAALVLLRMAEDGIKEFQGSHPLPILNTLYVILNTFNKFFSPITNVFLPHHKTTTHENQALLPFFLFSFSIPFILGLDDFAGYIPLFSLVNVVSFATGVFLGHMLLLLLLFASPSLTTKIIKQRIIVLLGSLAFIAIALWGGKEIISLVL